MPQPNSPLSLPDRLDEPVGQFVAALGKAFGSRLAAVYAYGSAVAGGYRRGVSDVNVLVVLDSVAAADLTTTQLCRRRARKAPLTVVVLGSDDLKALGSSQPATLWDIREQHRLLAGTHVLAAVELDRQALAAQARLELRDKLCTLRAAFAEHGSDARALTALAGASFGGVLHALRATLRLAGQAVPAEPVKAFGEVARQLGLDLKLLQTLHGLRQGSATVAVGDLTQFYDDYFALLASAAGQADRLAAPPVAEPEPKAKTKVKAERRPKPPVEPKPEPKPEPVVVAEAEPAPSPEPTPNPEPVMEPQAAEEAG